MTTPSPSAYPKLDETFTGRSIGKCEYLHDMYAMMVNLPFEVHRMYGYTSQDWSGFDAFAQDVLSPGIFYHHLRPLLADGASVEAKGRAMALLDRMNVMKMSLPASTIVEAIARAETMLTPMQQSFIKGTPRFLPPARTPAGGRDVLRYWDKLRRTYSNAERADTLIAAMSAAPAR